MSGNFLIPLCFIFQYLATQAEIVGVISPRNDANLSIWYAGTVEGKTFWAVRDLSHTLTWEEAGQACVDKNMKFAEVTSSVQANAIKQSGIETWAYWVAARDALELRQFSWNSSNQDVSNTDIQFGLNGGERFACLAFYPSVPAFLYYPCNRTDFFHTYLCEVTVPKCQAQK